MSDYCDRIDHLADVLAEIPELRADPALRQLIEQAIDDAGYRLAASQGAIERTEGAIEQAQEKAREDAA